jgi:Mrp family chromosome partitioning ATPase
MKNSQTAMWKMKGIDTLDGRYFVLSMSSKGGVAKSTTAINIAYELKAAGLDVGLVGVDIDSDNIPGMLKIESKGAVDIEDMFVPVVKDGIKIISIGTMLRTDSVVSKTGREIQTIIDDIIRWTRWGTTNIIVLDMPAGVSQEVRAVIQTVTRRRMAGAVIVTTPDTFEDMKRTIELCMIKAIPMIGVLTTKHGAVEADGAAIVKRDGTQYFPYGTDQQITKYLQENDVPYLGFTPLIDGFDGYRLPEFALGPIRNACGVVQDFMKTAPANNIGGTWKGTVSV